MRHIEIRIAGFGGQGVVLAGVLLGTAAVLFDNKKAVQTQSYGAEARGGGARSEVILSEERILYPRVTGPDIMVVMSKPALEKYLKDLKSGGILIADQDLVKEVPRGDYKVYRVPSTEIAVKELGNKMVANLIMLGFLVGLCKLVSVLAMEEAIKRTVPKGTEELNLKAFRRGLNLVEEIKTKGEGHATPRV